MRQVIFGRLLNRPDSGKVTAKGKGVRRDTESEGSRRQTSGLTDRNPICGLRVRIRLPKKSNSDNYPESSKVCLQSLKIFASV